VYHIDWKDIQLLVFSPDGYSYTTNAGRARSQGVELSVDSHPIAALNVSAWVAWNDAQLTEDVPLTASVVGKSGDVLPYGSRFSGNLSIDGHFPLAGPVAGFVGASLSYVGDRKGVFRAADLARQDFPGYGQLDLHAGATFDTWTLNAFVNNVVDRRALIGGDADNFVAFAYNYTQPRTVGMTVTKTF